MDQRPGAQIHAGWGPAGHPGQADQARPAGGWGCGRLAGPGPDWTPGRTPDQGDNLHILSPFIIQDEETAQPREVLSQGHPARE